MNIDSIQEDAPKPQEKVAHPTGSQLTAYLRGGFLWPASNRGLSAIPLLQEVLSNPPTSWKEFKHSELSDDQLKTATYAAEMGHELGGVDVNLSAERSKALWKYNAEMVTNIFGTYIYNHKIKEGDTSFHAIPEEIDEYCQTIEGKAAIAAVFRVAQASSAILESPLGQDLSTLYQKSLTQRDEADGYYKQAQDLLRKGLQEQFPGESFDWFQPIK